VRTEGEQVRVPKRREEMSAERMPVEGRKAPGAGIGEDEIVVPVTEEEVVVEKRPEVKEGDPSAQSSDAGRGVRRGARLPRRGRA
jgi:uncharacterized protein (TIGR02271 family)